AVSSRRDELRHAEIRRVGKAKRAHAWARREDAPLPTLRREQVDRDMLQPPMIRIRDLAMSYPGAGAAPAVRGISLDIPEGAFFTLLGPSGCGKTTTLRCVAGLERPDAGEIAIGDETVFSSANGIWVAPHDRNIGMVFQSYAIWPHMSVFDNVAFPLHYKRPRPSRAETRERAMAA